MRLAVTMTSRARCETARTALWLHVRASLRLRWRELFNSDGTMAVTLSLTSGAERVVHGDEAQLAAGFSDLSVRSYPADIAGLNQCASQSRCSDVLIAADNGC
jgi:hypothetical protein